MSIAAVLTPPPASPRRDPAPRLWTDAEFARMQQLGLFSGRDVELVAGVVRERGAGVPFVFTRKEYYALDDNHFFRDQRVQLIGGVILEETAMMNPPHATTIQLATRALGQVFDAGHDVRCQLPIDLGLVSEPEPDVAVVTGSPRDYISQHPTTALLVVEVAEATIDEDTHEKASLYASGGIADYWVIDLTTDRVLVFRSPQPDAKAKFGHDYASVSAFGRDDKLTPLAQPNARVPVSDLLP
jgi:Uma2 family endonuclease